MKIKTYMKNMMISFGMFGMLSTPAYAASDFLKQVAPELSEVTTQVFPIGTFCGAISGIVDDPNVEIIWEGPYPTNEEFYMYVAINTGFNPAKVGVFVTKSNGSPLILDPARGPLDSCMIELGELTSLREADNH